MNPKIIVHFTLSGRFDPEEITLSLGVKPSRIWRYGDPIQNTLLKYKHDVWRISTDEKESLDLQECIQTLLDLIHPYSSGLIKVSSRLNLKSEIACVINIEGDQVPAIHLNKEIIEAITELNAEFDIDLYL